MLNDLKKIDLINCILIKLNENDKQLLKIHLENNFLNVYPHFYQLDINYQMLTFSNYWTHLLVHQASNFDTVDTRLYLRLETEVNFYINTFINLIFPKLKEYRLVV